MTTAPEVLTRVYGQQFGGLLWQQWLRFVDHENRIATSAKPPKTTNAYRPLSKPMPHCAFCGAIEYQSWLDGAPETSLDLKSYMASALGLLGGDGSDHAHPACISIAISRQAISQAEEGL